jgi:hypothetical protein
MLMNASRSSRLRPARSCGQGGVCSYRNPEESLYDFVKKYAAGRCRETEEAFGRIYQEVVEDLVATIREKWVHGWDSDTNEMLLGEAAIKGIWLYPHLAVVLAAPPKSPAVCQ